MLCLSINSGYTKDLGRYGEAFPIGGMSLMALIDERLKALQQSGALAEWEKSVVKQVKHTMARPLGTKHTTTNHTQTTLPEHTHTTHNTLPLPTPP